MDLRQAQRRHLAQRDQGREHPHRRQDHQPVALGGRTIVPPEFIVDLAASAEASSLAGFVRRHAYFQVNLVHLLGLTMLIGAIGVADLRTLGAGRRLPAPDVHRFLVPIGIAGLLLMLASGALMFMADAKSLVGAGIFQLKVALIVLGVGNALLFQRLFGDLRGGVPPAAKAMAAFSLAVWLCAAAIGRLIGYV